MDDVWLAAPLLTLSRCKMTRRECRQPPEDKAMDQLEPDAPALKSGYVPTDRESKAVERTKARMAARPKVPKFTLESKDGITSLQLHHEDETTAAAMQVDALGLGSYEEFSSLFASILNFTTNKQGAADAYSANQALQLVIGMAPQNTTEAMLSVQMAAIHLATMDAARRMHATPLDIEVVTCNTKALNSLARTFATQAEALKKLRSGGPQRVVVEHKHYHLHQGADVTGGGVETETETKPHERRISKRNAVLGYIEANGVQVPGTGGEGLDGLPLPRREGRGPGRGH